MEIKDIELMFDMLVSMYPKSGFNNGRDTRRGLKNKEDYKHTEEYKARCVWWYKAMKSMETQVVFKALEMLIANEIFAPTLANIKEYYNLALEGDSLKAEEGWGYVKVAVRNYGYTRAKEAMQSLSEEIQEAVLLMGGWQTICESSADREETLRAQFRDCLKIVVNRKNIEKKSGVSVKMLQVHQEAKGIECVENREREQGKKKDFSSVEEALKDIRKRVGC